MKKFTATLLAFCLSAPTFATQAENAPNENAGLEKQIVLQVEEMTCQLCAYLVNKELREVEGVISTKANINEHVVKIVAQQNVTDHALIQAVEKLHYSAKIVR